MKSSAFSIHVPLRVRGVAPLLRQHARAALTSALDGVWRKAVLLLAALSLSLCAVTRAEAQVCASPGNDGPAPSLGGIVNTYFPGTANASAGTTSITVGSAHTGGALTAIAPGDLLLVMQMQDAQISSTNDANYGSNSGTGSGVTGLSNSGRYEYVVATNNVSSAGGTITIRSTGTGNGLVYTYTNANATGTRGQRRFQVVRVPQYSSATLLSSLTAAPWNGSSGGILAIEVTGNLNLGGASVNVTGRGFRGGGARQLTGATSGTALNTDYVTLSTAAYNSSKGEGIAGMPRYIYDGLAVVDNTTEGYPNGSFARGAPGNAGGGGTDGHPIAATAGQGNDENSGGGGGANGGAGGRGGNTWNSNLQRGGLGGTAVTGAANRIVMGGGGGAGTRNNSSGTMSSGGAGGGIVMIRAGTVSGTGTITSDGLTGVAPENDGGGGGGAGGSIMVVANSGGLGSLTVRARGGRGTDSNLIGPNQGSAHGPGGGGGGGFVALSGAATIDVSGGANGLTTGNVAFGATAGTAGASLSITASSVPGATIDAQCVPVLTVLKTTSTPSVNNTPTGTTATYTIRVSNAANLADAEQVAISDTLPAGFTWASTGSVTLTGGATRPTTTNPTVGAAVPAYTSFTIPGGGQVQITFTVNIAAGVSGTFQNPATAVYQDPARTAVNGTTSASYNSASSTGEDVTVLGPPNILLDKCVFNGPQCVASIASVLPGAELLYSITFTNNGGSSASNFVVRDPIPANTDFKLGSVVNNLGTTGLTVTVAYSNNGGTTWTYTPVSGAGGAPAGFDRTVTHIRWTFGGNLSQTAPNNTGNVRFTVRIR